MKLGMRLLVRELRVEVGVEVRVKAGQSDWVLNWDWGLILFGIWVELVLNIVLRRSIYGTTEIEQK